MASYKDKLDRFKRRNGQQLTRYKFAYRDASQLRRKVNEVYCLMLIASDKWGASILEFRFRRAAQKTPRQWHNFIKDQGIEIFRERVLGAINAKTGDDWSLVKFIVFGVNGSKDAI